MKKNVHPALVVLFTSIASVWLFSLAHTPAVKAESAVGPLYSSREKLTLTRDKATGAVSGSLAQGNIAVAYVNLWERQDLMRAQALYIPPATITDVQPVILYGHCDLAYKFQLQQGKLTVSGSCTGANWAEPPIEVVVLYAK